MTLWKAFKYACGIMAASAVFMSILWGMAWCMLWMNHHYSEAWSAVILAALVLGLLTVIIYISELVDKEDI